MRCLVLGNAKNGTTALFHAIAQSVRGAVRYFEEPIAMLDLGSGPAVAKVLFENEDPVLLRKFAMDFDKRIVITRDPRDNLVSRALYSVARPDIVADTDRLTRLLELIENKQRDPSAVDFMALLHVLCDGVETVRTLLKRELTRHNALHQFILTSKPAWFTITYEKLVGGQFDELSDYLGFAVDADYAIHPNYRRVVRTRKSGDWRNWFTASDIEYLEPLFRSELTHSPYRGSWDRHEHPVIPPAHGTGYVRMLIQERRAKFGLPAFPAELARTCNSSLTSEGSNMNTVACNLCGGQDFSPGPAERLSQSGRPPHCKQCGSLERQRILRRVFQGLPLGFLDWRKGLQFSPDFGIDPNWFRHYEVSIYGGANSLDMQAIDRPDGSYDFVSFNHVLEFIPDDRAGFAELVRILSPRGIIQACFSAPLSRETCQDFDQPFGPHAAWHLYGRDLEIRFQCRERGLTLLAVEETDPCTGVREVIHLFCKDPADASRLRSWLRNWSDTIHTLERAA